MIKIRDILTEASYNTYVGMIKVVYKIETPTRIAEMIRALPGVTTVTLTSHSKNNAILRVKLISQKPGIEAFEALRTNAVEKYLEVRVVKVAENTIEKKDTHQG